MLIFEIDNVTLVFLQLTFHNLVIRHRNLSYLSRFRLNCIQLLLIEFSLMLLSGQLLFDLRVFSTYILNFVDLLLALLSDLKHLILQLLKTRASFSVPILQRLYVLIVFCIQKLFFLF